MYLMSLVSVWMEVILHINYVVMPFMINGDLLSYLKKERNNLVVSLDEELDGTMVKENTHNYVSCLHVK